MRSKIEKGGRKNKMEACIYDRFCPCDRDCYGSGCERMEQLRKYSFMDKQLDSLAEDIRLESSTNMARRVKREGNKTGK